MTPAETAISGLIDELIGVVTAHRRATASAQSLTVPQLLSLRAVAQLEAPTPAAVASRARLSRSNLTAVLDKLEKRGWLERRRSQKDRRSVLLGLTPSGLALVSSLADPLETLLSEVLPRLDASQVQEVERSLRLLCSSLVDAQRASEDCAPEMIRRSVGNGTA